MLMKGPIGQRSKKQRKLGRRARKRLKKKQKKMKTSLTEKRRIRQKLKASCSLARRKAFYYTLQDNSRESPF